MRTLQITITVLLGVFINVPMSSAEPDSDFNTLKTMTRYTDAHVGIAGETPEAVHALRRMLAVDDAANIFKRLLREATIEGQLYALCGLYFTDPVAFRAALPQYESSTQKVETQWGCRLGDATVAELVHSQHEPVMKLEPGQSPSEWRKSHQQDGYTVDISGGGFCHILRGTLWDDEGEQSN